MKDIIQAFDLYLNSKDLSFEAVVIGASALIILEIVDRRTMDVDCLDPKINPGVKEASIQFARSNPKFLLQDNWLNNGPTSLKNDLPKNWRSNVVSIFKGVSISFFTLGRLDLLRTKLFAYCDRQSDHDDCVAFKPTLDELKTCFPWVKDRDASPLWPDHVTTSFQQLAGALGYEFKP